MSSEAKPGQVIIVLIWRGTVMPNETEREKELEAFRQELADVLDWNTEQYDEDIVLMYT
jgi:hypothetical protein